MLITATEFKKKIGRFLDLAVKQDIYISKNGKIVAKLTTPYHDRIELAKSLFGILPEGASIKQAREERLSLNESID